MLHIPRVRYSLSIAPLKAISGWADNFSDDERSLLGGRELVHAFGLLDAPEDEVANIEGGFLDVAVMISSKLLIVTSLSHDGNKSLFFEAIEVDAACLLGLSFLVELDAWSSKGDVGRKNSFRSVDQKEGRKACGRADLSP
jgi:hypothetical protein